LGCHYILLHRFGQSCANRKFTGCGRYWWNDLIGVNKTIDTTKYTVLAFNVPGNGFDGAVIENYLDFARDIARIL
jgi:homoserine acetyltransferase